MITRKRFRFLFVIGLWFSCLPLNADNSTPSPWLTGPLIAPPGIVVQGGHFDIEPYLFVTVGTGVYTRNWQTMRIPHFWSINPQLFTIIGLTQWMDLQLTPQVFYNTTQGVSSCHFGDLPIGLDLQILSADYAKYIPGIKFTLKETFPTGKYQKLNPHKLATDVSGAGSYATNFNLVFYKILHFSGLHFMSTTLSFAYTVSAPVHVKGHNFYGGGAGTDGTVRPGNAFVGLFSIEYTLNQNWAFALDNVYTHQNKNHFSGHPGTSAMGAVATFIKDSSEQVTFAPAIEYNFSSAMGAIAGVWFSAFGRNSARFISGVAAFNYSY